jgi:hypothetical protein
MLALQIPQFQNVDIQRSLTEAMLVALAPAEVLQLFEQQTDVIQRQVRMRCHHHIQKVTTLKSYRFTLKYR